MIYEGSLLNFSQAVSAIENRIFSGWTLFAEGTEFGRIRVVVSHTDKLDRGYALVKVEENNVLYPDFVVKIEKVSREFAGLQRIIIASALATCLIRYCVKDRLLANLDGMIDLNRWIVSRYSREHHWSDMDPDVLVNDIVHARTTKIQRMVSGSESKRMWAMMIRQTTSELKRFEDNICKAWRSTHDPCLCGDHFHTAVLKGILYMMDLSEPELDTFDRFISEQESAAEVISVPTLIRKFMDTIRPITEESAE